MTEAEKVEREAWHLIAQIGRYVSATVCDYCREDDCDRHILSTCKGWRARRLFRQRAALPYQPGMEDGWEYEDELQTDITPGMYAASKVDVVRLYPYIETPEGRRYLSAS